MVSATILLGFELPGVAICSGISYFSLLCLLVLFIFKQFTLSIKQYHKALTELVIPFCLMLVIIWVVNFFLAGLAWHALLVSATSIGLFVMAYAPLLYWALKHKRLVLPGKIGKRFTS